MHVVQTFWISDMRDCEIIEVGTLCTNSKEGRQLLPSLGTLKPHIQETFYMALVCNQSIKPCPNIVPAANLSWERQDGHLVPVLRIKMSSPKALLELPRGSYRSSCKTDMVAARIHCCAVMLVDVAMVVKI